MLDFRALCLVLCAFPALLAGCASERDAWRTAGQVDTPDAANARFLKESPGGRAAGLRRTPGAGSLDGKAT